MKMHIVAIRDIKADVFAQPFFTASIGGAIRGFGDEVNRAATDNMLYKHPDDFELYHLGEYDDANARFELLETPKQLVAGGSCVIKS